MYRGYYLTIAVILACSDNGSTIEFYPADEGNHWTYLTTTVVEYPDSNKLDTLFIYRSDVTLTRIGEFYGMDDVIQAEIRWYEIYSAIGRSFDTLYSYVWYQQDAKELREVAYYQAGSPFVFPKRLPKLELSDAAPSFWSAQQDTLFRERIVLRFPLHAGREWIAFTDPWVQEVNVIKTKNVVVPAGNFESLQLQHRNEEQYELTFYSYFAAVGLVKRTLSVLNIENTTEENPDGDGSFYHYHQSTELTDYFITANGK
jgi:hypothetical protein